MTPTAATGSQAVCWPFLTGEGSGNAEMIRHTEPGPGNELTTGSGCAMISYSERNPVELGGRLAATGTVSQ